MIANPRCKQPQQLTASQRPAQLSNHWIIQPKATPAPVAAAERALVASRAVMTFLVEAGFWQIALSRSGVGHFHAAGYLGRHAIAVLIEISNWVPLAPPPSSRVF